MSLRELIFDIGFKGDATAVIKTNKAVDELKSETLKVGSALDNISNSKFSKFGNAGKSAFGKIKSYVDTADKSVSRLSKSFDATAGKLDSISNKTGKLGNTLSLGVTVPMTIAGKKIFSTFTDFEAKMSEVKAISGATQKEFESLNKIAREMGATTKFSASDSADALKYMAQSGWDTQKMISGLPGVMKLAAASGEDLALSSSIVTGSMTAFGIEAEKAGMFADVLAQAANASNTGVAEMGETFKYVGPVAGALKYNIQDIAIATGLMANVNVKGGQAGTALRGALSRMVKPTDDAQAMMTNLGISLTDTQGKMKPFKTVMDDMRLGFSKLNDDEKTLYATTIFGQESMSGMLGIINASTQDYDKLTKSIYNSAGAASTVEKIMGDNTKGDLAEASSALEELGLKIGTVAGPDIRKGIQSFTQFIQKLGKMDDATFKTTLKIALFVAALGPMFKTFSLGTKGLSKISKGLSFITKYNVFWAIGKSAEESGKGIKFVTGSVGKLKTGLIAIKTLGVKGAFFKGIGMFKAFAVSMLPAILTIGLLVAAGYLLYKNWDMIKAEGIEFTQSLQAEFGSFVPTVQALWGKLKEIFLALLPVFGGVLGAVIGALGGFITLFVGTISGVVKILKGLTDFILGVFTGDWKRAWEGIKDIFSGVIDTIKGIFEGVMGFFGGIINKFTDGVKVGEETANKARDRATTPNSVTSPKVKGRFATGVRNFSGGLALVGEEGPEIVHLPRGSDVLNNRESIDIFKNSKRFMNMSPTTNNTRSYDNSTVSTNNKNTKIINISSPINITTTSDKPEEIANMTKNKIKQVVYEIIDDEELAS